MNKLVQPSVPPASQVRCEPRPFSFLKPRHLGATPPKIEPGGKAALGAFVGEAAPALARALVAHSVKLWNEQGRLAGRRQPIQVAALNRRRRAARAWIQSILSCAVDPATLHAVATQWLPMLAGQSGPAKTGQAAVRSCVEFVRGIMTGLLFEEPQENLMGAARGLHALETVLALHLCAALTAAAPQDD